MPCSVNALKVDLVDKPYLVWYEEDWVHDDALHAHRKAQLVYVERGFQYLTVGEKKYLLPQHHAAWIPSGALHKTNTHSAKIRLMVLFFEVTAPLPFYEEVCVFAVPPVMKEMIRYAEKWSKSLTADAGEAAFLYALYKELPAWAAQSLQLHMALPRDARLRKAVDFLHDRYTGVIAVEAISEAAGLSLRTLERIFKKETGLTLSKYQQMLRIIKSLELLSAKEFTVSEIAFKVGYKSLQAFTNSFMNVMQYRPTDFLKGH